MKRETIPVESPARRNNFRVRVQPVRLGPYRNFQVRIGMDGDGTLDYVPLYRSAFASILQVEVAHAARQTAEMEAQMVAEFLGCQLQG